MVKIQCRECGEIGYTASTSPMRCECGGKFKIVPGTARKEKNDLNDETPELLATLTRTGNST